MNRITLKKVLAGLDYESNLPLGDIELSGIKINSKDVRKGDLFIAIKGSKTDGHVFLEEAFKKGAAAAVVCREIPGEYPIIKVKDTIKSLPLLSNNFYDNPSGRMKMIGVTGTNGKTTTSYLVSSIMERAGFKTATLGTITYRIGEREYPSGMTTPDAVTINDMLRRAARQGTECVAMEVSSHALEQGRVAGIGLDAAIFTNLTAEHLDYHKDMESYFRSKARIFGRLKPGGPAILNLDDPWAGRIIKLIKCGIVTYGLKKSCSVRADIQSAGLAGSAATIYHGNEKIAIRTRLIGRHNMYNILASAAAAFSLKVRPEHIKEGIEGLKSVPGRLQAVDCGQPFRVFVDYAHTHDALENILNALNTVKKKKLITVFGCGGDRDRTKRPLMGKVATSLSDSIIITSDNPRTEDPKSIISDVEKGINKKRYKYSVIEDRKKAIEAALRLASRDDIVLIAGKGHETVQIVGDKRIYFNDAEVIREALCSR